MSDTRWSIDKWQDLLRVLFRPEHVAFFPHKIFRWDAQGIYRDCFFPFACQHLLGGEAILGKSMKEVLPKQASHSLKRAFALTQRLGLPQDVQCVLPSGDQSYVASVRLFPYDSEVLGFVTDYDLTGNPVVHVAPGHPSISFLERKPVFYPISATSHSKAPIKRIS